jgi:ribosome biogenesis protein Nip4
VPSDAEGTVIAQGLGQYLEPSAVEELLRDKHLLIGTGNRQEVYLLSASVWQLYQTVCPWRHPYFVGLHLGELEPQGFVPSLHILQRLVAKARAAALVKTTAEGAQRFIYGHDLELSQLQQVPPDTGNRGMLVVNEQGEGIGYGSFTTDKRGKTSFRNRKDLGWYLRRGQ